MSEDKAKTKKAAEKPPKKDQLGPDEDSASKKKKLTKKAPDGIHPVKSARGGAASGDKVCEASILSPKPQFNGVNLDVEEMMEHGLHLGHRTTRGNPKMKPYILGVRNTVHLIDLEKTLDKFKEALEFIHSVIAEDKIILFVGTKIQTKDLVKELAEEFNQPYVTERWLGGTFTNFSIIAKRVKYLKELEEKARTGELQKYTKKERIKINLEMERLKIKFEGLKNLSDLPEAIFVLDMNNNAPAVKEARIKGVKVIGVSDTNADPTLADYPIPANDDAISSVKYILEKVKQTISKAKLKLK